MVTADKLSFYTLKMS